MAVVTFRPSGLGSGLALAAALVGCIGVGCSPTARSEPSATTSAQPSFAAPTPGAQSSATRLPSAPAATSTLAPSSTSTASTAPPSPTFQPSGSPLAAYQ